MKKKQTIGQQLLHSTVRILCENAKGEKSSGTGFNLTIDVPNAVVPVIVTNRHVFEGQTRCEFQYTLADADGNPTDKIKTIEITNFEKTWIGHPDPKVDLAILPIQQVRLALEAQNELLFYVNLSQGIIATQEMLDDLDAIEDVTMIGYPNGIFDHVNNLPVVRRGITATAPNTDFRGEKEFVIDAACFPGSSGSPVFIFNNGAYAHSGGITMGTRLMLIGILYGGFQHTAVGEIRQIPIPTALKPVPVSSIPNNLGICIQAVRILDFKPILEERIAKKQTDASKKEEAVEAIKAPPKPTTT